MKAKLFILLIYLSLSSTAQNNGEAKTLFVNFPLDVGASYIEMDKKDVYVDRGSTLSDNNASFAYAEPGVALEMNLHKYVKLNFSASYRFVSDVTFRSLKAKDLTGPNCGVSLKIGLF